MSIQMPLKIDLGGTDSSAVIILILFYNSYRVRKPSESGSLVKRGFRISGVKEIFDGAVTEAQNEISFEVDHLIDAMDGIEFI